MICYLLGSVIANRTYFEPQNVYRKKQLIDSTPDHVILQLWRTGGYRGEIGRRQVDVRGGRVALADRRSEIDVRFTASDTVGFAVPREALHGILLDDKPLLFDPQRNKLAATHILSLYRQIPELDASGTKRIEGEFVAFLRRLLDPSEAADVLEGSELDQSRFNLARARIAASLGSRELTPAKLAAEMNVSRATLFRAFESHGGIARFIGEQRLLAVKAALGDPLERRSMSQLSSDLGFTSLTILSRSFRQRFGGSMRDWRNGHARGLAPGVRSSATARRWWYELGT